MEPNIVLYDVEGTIIKGGEESPKARAIQKLQQFILEQYATEKHPWFSAILGETKEAWEQKKGEFLEDEKYFKRFFQTEEEVAKATELEQGMVWYEGLKAVAPDLAKENQGIMIRGIKDGSLPCEAYEDITPTMKLNREKGYIIATYSGANRDLQEIMLSRIQIGDSTLAHIITGNDTGAGYHDKKEFGNKTKASSYQKAFAYFEKQGFYLAVWVTDSLEEALCCRKGAPYTRSIFIDRKKQGIENNTIEIVQDLREVTW